MVRIGEHSLELVHATTKATLPEYTSRDGETWVEGRPGDEYLIKLTSHQSGTRSVADPILVDGARVGYFFQLGLAANLTAVLGPIPTGGAANVAGHITCPAFRFSCVSSSEQIETTRHGTVSVTLSDARDTGQPATVRFPSSWKEAQASAADSKKEGVGALKSTFGSSSVEMSVAETTYVATNRLYTITIRYCEQAGLVARKIIPAPKAAAAVSTTSSNTSSDNDDNHQRHGPARKKKKSNDGGSARRAAKSVVGAAEVVDLTADATTTTTSEEPVGDRAHIKQESRAFKHRT